VPQIDYMYGQREFRYEARRVGGSGTYLEARIVVDHLRQPKIRNFENGWLVLSEEYVLQVMVGNGGTQWSNAHTSHFKSRWETLLL
jgi:hypothetical protein